MNDFNYSLHEKVRINPGTKIHNSIYSIVVAGTWYAHQPIRSPSFDSTYMVINPQWIFVPIATNDIVSQCNEVIEKL